MSQTRASMLRPPSTALARTRRWTARIGAIALIGLGTAHTVTNAIGFAAQPGGSWPVFLIFGPGLGVLLAVIGVVSWRQANRVTIKWPVRGILILAGLFCLVAVVNVLRLHPEMIWVPAGPGPWATVGAPTLLITALLPSASHVDRRPSLPWWLAAAWSLTYLVLGSLWALGGPGYPFDGGGPGPGASVLDPLSPTAGGWLLAGLAGLSAALLTRAARRRPTRIVGILLAVVGVTVSVVLTDVRVLMVIGYLPLMVITALLGRIDPGTAAAMFVWSNLNQMVLMVAGVCLVSVGVPILVAPSRADGIDTDTDGARAAAALRVGRWATVVAVVIPLGYAVTRIGWFLGIPVGISDEFLRRLVEAEATPIGAGLAMAGLAGAVLTTGLVRPWGEVWPGWIPLLGLRTIPARLPGWLALAVAVPITSAGWMYVRKKLTGQQVGPTGAGAELGAWLPEMFWPVWGIALATAALAYLARRGTGRQLRPTPGSDLTRVVTVR